MKKVTVTCDKCKREETFKDDFLMTLPHDWSELGLNYRYDLCNNCTQEARNAIFNWLHEK